MTQQALTDEQLQWCRDDDVRAAQWMYRACPDIWLATIAQRDKRIALLEKECDQMNDIVDAHERDDETTAAADERERLVADLNAIGELAQDLYSIPGLCKDVAQARYAAEKLHRRNKGAAADSFAKSQELADLRAQVVALTAERDQAKAEAAVLLEELSSREIGTSYGEDGKPLKQHCLVCRQTWPEGTKDRHAATCVIAHQAPLATALLSELAEARGKMRTANETALPAGCMWVAVCNNCGTDPANAEHCHYIDELCPIKRAAGEG